jgi:hypothetical protein
MVHSFNRRLLTLEALVRARFSPCAICGGPSVSGIGFSAIFPVFPLSISFLRGFPYSYITRGMNTRPAGGRSSET